MVGCQKNVHYGAGGAKLPKNGRRNEKGEKASPSLFISPQQKVQSSSSISN